MGHGWSGQFEAEMLTTTSNKNLANIYIELVCIHSLLSARCGEYYRIYNDTSYGG